MARRKPTLTREVLRHYGVAAAVTLLLIMAGLLLLADQLALRGAAQAMAHELRTQQAEDVPCPPTMACSRQGGRVTLGLDGLPVQQGGPMFHGGQGEGCGLGMGRMGEPWALTGRVLADGELQGAGALPWLDEPVVWAARIVKMSNNDVAVQLAWSRVSAIRAATTSTYGLVVLATLLAFLVSTLLTLRTMRGITRVITQVTESGRRMADGDYRVHVPEQPTVELDHMARVITDLASSLDVTVGELHREHNRLERLEGLQRQFVADASHELRAPLAAMAITLDAWHDGLLRADEQPKAVEQLREETHRLGAMVSKLLDLSRIESGRESLTLAPVEAAGVVQRVVEAVQAMPGAPISVDLPPALPPVTADADALYRALRNLVENARQFTPPDGTIRIWAMPDGDMLRLGVTDTGSGIAAEDLPHVWDRFARSAQARAEGKIGSGLGLAIVKALVEAMGGEVGMDSTPGAGTTAWLRLPLS
jgi:signal transduction histidine kinase